MERTSVLAKTLKLSFSVSQKRDIRSLTPAWWKGREEFDSLGMTALQEQLHWSPASALQDFEPLGSAISWCTLTRPYSFQLSHTNLHKLKIWPIISSCLLQQ